MPIAYPFAISFCSIGLRNKPVAEALEQIAQAGFRGVEIWWPHLEKLTAEEQQAVAGQCRKLGPDGDGPLSLFLVHARRGMAAALDPDRT